ncbi:uncharacterized protein BP5553_05054 [Venustampulla echinocandica]|uniref:BTB domain-containing protein n=1 Tax=Venustampulla echinocandica TaxID=2656787 RepID=A0A370TQ20_9HELO|nr:uncharacterized protein BP5553_05054 [Venustampulla echinocandica]RDL37621.1 hypothetical protein BP5553_05054 [Venustampulla echinocandica]
MEPETLVFMPNGDVTLTLIRHIEEEVHSSISRTTSSSSLSALGQSNTSIEEDAKAVASDAPTGLETAEPPEAEPEDDELFYAPDPPTGEDGPLYPPPPRCSRGSDASSRRDRSTSPPGSFWAALKRQKERILTPNEEAPAVIPPKARESRHKKVVSTTQETLLSGNFDEAVTLRATGHVTIQLSGDPETLVILLNIIHGATRKVPRQVNLDLLRKLAVLVKDFKMLESVEFFSDTWIDKLKGDGMPQSYSDDVIQLLFVFLVFDREDEFKNMTRLIQRECDEKFDEQIPEVPIPHGIIDAIKRDRQFAIETAITVIHGFITKYMDGLPICDSGMDVDLRFACDAMLLGSLMKGCGKIGIWPKPDAPFTGRKWNNLAREIRGIKILDVCSRSSSRRWGASGPSSNCHGLEDSIEDSMKSIEEGLDGLKLSDYVNKSEDSWGNFLSHIIRPTPAANDETPKEMVRVFLKEDTKEQFPSMDGVIAPPNEEMEERAFEHVNIPPEETRSTFQSRERKAPPQADLNSAQYDHGKRLGETNIAISQNNKKVEAPQAKPTTAYYERMRMVVEETPATYQNDDTKESTNGTPNMTQYEHARRGSEEHRPAFQSDSFKEPPQAKPAMFQSENTRKVPEEPRTTSPIRDWKGIQNGKAPNSQYEHFKTAPEERRATPPTPKEDSSKFAYPPNGAAPSTRYEHVKTATEERRTTPPTPRDDSSGFAYPPNGAAPSTQYEHVKTATEERRATQPTTKEDSPRYSYPSNSKAPSAQYEHAKIATPPTTKEDDSRFSYPPNGKALSTLYEHTRASPEERRASPPTTKEDSSRYSYPSHGKSPNGLYEQVKAVPDGRRATPPTTKEDSSRYSFASNGKALNGQYEVKTVSDERRATPPTAKDDSSRFSYPQKSQQEQLPKLEQARVSPNFEMAKQQESRPSPKFDSPKQEEAKPSSKFGSSFFSSKSDITPAAQKVEAKEPPEAESPKEERKASPTMDLKDLNTTTEEDDLFIQPHNFRARKSKKRFAVSRRRE